MGRKLESEFAKILKDELEEKLPGCLILKQDPNQRQGILDYLVLYKDRWAMLETKRGLRERKTPQPNQEYYVEKLNDMSYAAFVHPENYREVISEIQSAFGA